MMAVAMMTVPSHAEILRFADLEGWAADDHRAALSSFRETCGLLDDADWVPLCKLAEDAGDSAEGARQFFELFFRPVVIGAPPALFTGYYEPELEGSPVRTPRFAWPIYRRPP
jgi:membrane-bound lytic murein transglycosylase A